MPIDSMTREQRIRERAYALWETAGKPGGEHDYYWREAEAQIEAEDAAGAVVPEPGRAR